MGPLRGSFRLLPDKMLPAKYISLCILSQRTRLVNVFVVFAMKHIIYADFLFVNGFCFFLVHNSQIVLPFLSFTAAHCAKQRHPLCKLKYSPPAFPLPTQIPPALHNGSASGDRTVQRYRWHACIPAFRQVSSRGIRESCWI